MRIRGSLLGGLCLCALLASPVRAQEAELDTGLRFRAIVVARDLSLRPVPKRTFLIRSADQPAVVLRVTTDFEGTAAIGLSPGSYVLTSESPLAFEESLFTWEVPFEVSAGLVSDLELSNDNAVIEQSQPAVVPLNEGELYRRFRGSVFKVLSDGGHGSGFLVDSAGLVLTNHHVVADSDYLAVKVDEHRKYPAQLVAENARHDLAILRIHPSAVRDVVALQLAEDAPDRAPVSVGERVVAIGSPLATEAILTSGIVSKVEEGAIYSDVNINPGNSGGPLLSSRGQVIGITTFSLTSSGPGVSGIVRIHLASELLNTAAQRLADLPAPTERLLPVESAFPYPATELERLAAQPLNSRAYHVESGKIDIQFITPVVVATLETAADRDAADQRSRRSRGKQVDEYKPGEGFYEWRRYGGDYRPVVVVQAVPEITLTVASAFAVALVGASAPQEYRFKADFDRMELRRGETVVEPIHPKRYPNRYSFQAGVSSMNDVAFYGSYEYPPEAFAPGEALTIQVWKQGDATPNLKAVGEDVRARVWADFLPYFRALQQAAASD
jgi:S1-C subfamily serine protease